MKEEEIYQLMCIASDLKQKEMAMQKVFGKDALFATDSIDHIFWLIHDSLGLPKDNWGDEEEKYIQMNPNASLADVYQYMSENPEAYCSDAIWDTFHDCCAGETTPDEFLKIAKETAEFYKKPIQERIAIMKTSQEQQETMA